MERVWPIHLVHPLPYRHQSESNQFDKTGLATVYGHGRQRRVSSLFVSAVNLWHSVLHIKRYRSYSRRETKHAAYDDADLHRRCVHKRAIR